MATLDSSNAVPAEKLFSDLMGDLTVTRAILDGAYELVNASEYTDRSESLCHVRTLLDTCLGRLSKSYTKIDIGDMAASRAKLVPIVGRSRSELEEFGGEVCRRASAAQSMLLAALELMRKDNHDQSHKEIFQGCEVIETAAALLYELCGDAVDAEITMAKLRGGKTGVALAA